MCDERTSDMSVNAKRFWVRVKVVAVKKPCKAGHKVGDEVVFTYNQVEGSMCFDAMCTMMPKVHSLRYNARFPWLKDPKDPARHSCPDEGNVVYELSQITGED
jgi:uncharacterized repeat protein (TIGR04076 family)